MRLSSCLSVLASVCVLASCGGGGGSNPPPAPHTIGGTADVSGSGLVLLNNGSDMLPVSSGTFTFTQTVLSGNPYNVTVSTQPTNPSQTCTVAHGAGTVSGSDITNVAVTCTTNSYTVSATVSGLTGTGLVVANNGGDAVPVTASGPIAFPTAIKSGNPYSVTVSTAPTNPPQSCTVANASGTVAASNVTNVTVTCNTASKQLLVLDNHGNVWSYFIDPTTGGLGGSVGPSSLGLCCIATDPTGKFVYGAPLSMGTGISVYTISANTGALTPIAGSPFSTGATSPGYLILDPTGKYLYSAAFNSINVLAYTINAATGALTPIAGSPFPGSNGGFGFCCFFGASTKFLYYTQLQGAGAAFMFDFRIDALTGALTSVGQVSDINADNAVLAVDPAGRFVFILHGQGIESYAVDALTGALTLVAQTPLPPTQAVPRGIAVDPTAKHVYVPSASSGVPSVVYAYSIDATTGALTPVSGSPFATRAGSGVPLAFDPTGTFVYMASSSVQNGVIAAAISCFAVDATTGALTEVPGSPFAILPGAYNLVVTPIP